MNKYFLALVVFLLAILFSVIGYQVGLNVSSDTGLYKRIILLDVDYPEISLAVQEGELYYELAGYSYEDQDYKSVESNCRISRQEYFKATGLLSKQRAKISDDDEPILLLYREAIDEEINIYNNIYEACEYFESAARYYDKYFNTDVAYDDMSFDIGTAEIENMNEKIKAHDEAVVRYNNLLEEYKLALNNLILADEE